MNFVVGDEDGLVVLDQGGVMCITCGKVLTTVSTGNRHVREKHRPNQQAQCRICKQSYKNDRVLGNHYKMAHGVSAKQMKNYIRVPDTSQNTSFDENLDVQYYD